MKGFTMSQFIRLRFKLFCLLIVFLTALPGTLWAQAVFPTKPVNLIVPFPPGGVVDLTGRSFAQSLFKVWGQPVVINTKAGAGGAVGMSSASIANSDGYTLLATHSSILALPESERIFGRTLNFDRSSFTPLALLVADPLVLVVKADSPWKSYEDFVAAARKNPDTIAYSSSGAYSALHLPIEMLANSANIKLRHIPYSGGGPAITAVLSGVVSATVGSPAVLAPQIKNGELRALVSTGLKRTPVLPDVPTAYELGYKDVEFYIWVGLFAPSKIDPVLAQSIRRDIKKAIQDPEFVEHMSKIGSPLDYRDGPSFVSFLDKDSERIVNAIKRIGKVE
jgi:tripartite-type tricarboxylate transporter receptor subunit TctC